VDHARNAAKFDAKIPAAHRATFVIDTNRKVTEVKVDRDAVDATKVVTF
jgi:hypothetical protein